MDIEVIFKDAVVLYMVAAISNSTAVLLTFLCHQLTAAAKGKGQILQGLFYGKFSFPSFQWLKFLFLLVQPRDK